MSSSTESPIVVDSTVTAPSTPVATLSSDSANVVIRSGLATAINLRGRCFDDVVKPSIKSFIETSQTNPRVAAVVGTPALLAFLFTVAFLVFSILTLVIWTVITMAFGIVFVVIGGFKALLLKLTLVIMTAIPLAAVGTGLLICGNSIAQVIIKGIPTSLNFGGGSPSSVDEVDWQKVAEASLRNLIQWTRYVMPLFHTALETTTTVIRASYASLRTAAVLMHDAAARDAALSSSAPPQSQNESAENLASTSRSMEPVAPIQRESDNEMVIIEPVDISSSSATGAPNPTLQQRTSFRHLGDNEDN